MTGEQRAIVRRFQRAAPVDITAMATGLGLTVYEDSDMSRGESGMILRDRLGESFSGYTIFVNANEPYLRRRFTIAHECAHFLIHKDKIGDGITDDPMYRSENMNSQEEFEANNLAADLLMPRDLVVPCVKEGFSDLTELADRFQVSALAMRVRLRYLYRFDYIPA